MYITKDREKSREKWDSGGSPVVYVHCQTGKSLSVPLLKSGKYKKRIATMTVHVHGMIGPTSICSKGIMERERGECDGK